MLEKRASMLSVTNVQILYDRAIEAVRDVSLEVGDQQIVALLGSNGAGKSTILKAISNVLYPEEGEVLHGHIRYRGTELLKLPADDIVRSGIVHVPEGRKLFAHMTVEDNLAMGGYLRSRSQVAEGFDRVYAMFPRVAERRKSLAGYLSGGEQQMVAIGRALMASPQLLMLDEPSLGLAPQIIEQIMQIIVDLNRSERMSILLVEQNALLALRIAHRAYVMESGRVVIDGEASKIVENDDVKEFYLGFSESGSRKSYREIKHYKRRKRWLS
ncbi:ABC transporter ATP-binding protein [Bradyrhizobium genosp. SA-3]|uniref:ABC transporter ATP-binding protein n=1 Tax=Bradyrhizobium genosp. SA-3 TaxID=508868 RepID=UPI001AC00523|nr:ABC transporter ATP-binding protein [Bradyrhizobium genosp. SA-3]